jgi:YHS domain-containing protein
MKKIRRVFFLVVLNAMLIPAYSQVVDPVDKNMLANGGFDLVAYFTDNAAVKGDKKFTYERNNVYYQFASAAHLEMFKANPEKYLPQCGGYCAYGVAEKGRKVPVNPQTFKVVDGKLYLFFNGDANGKMFNTLPEWNKNEKQLVSQLPARWQSVK